MTLPRASIASLSRAALRDGSAQGDDSNEAPIAQRMVTRLRASLVPSIGPAGFDAILGRSLVLARRDDASLEAITVGEESTLVGTADAAAPEECAVAIVSHFIELLIALTGEDVAMWLLRDLSNVKTKDGE